ncbi:MAG: flagellar hook-length control protein FliK [Armatimonadetes bacterium]|nr:flagellar hook-length control protein FliK [Armatimonadota bacterium]
MHIPDNVSGPGQGPRIRPDAPDTARQIVLDHVSDLGLERSVGQIVNARVSFLMGNKAVLEINGRFVAAEAHIPLSAGDRLAVRVRSYDGQRAVLQVVDQKERPANAPSVRQDVETLLNRFGLKGTPEEKALATSLLEHGFGLDENTMKALAVVAGEGPISEPQVKALMFARAHGIPITEATREAVETFLAEQQQMGQHVRHAVRVLAVLASALAGIGVEAPGSLPSATSGPRVVLPVSGAAPLEAAGPGVPDADAQAGVPARLLVPETGPVESTSQAATATPATLATTPEADPPVAPPAVAPDAQGSSAPRPGAAEGPLPALPPEEAPIPAPGAEPGKSIAGNTPSMTPPPLPPGVSHQMHGLALSLRAAFATGAAEPGFENARQLVDTLVSLQAALSAHLISDETSAASVRHAVQTLTNSIESQLMRLSGKPAATVTEEIESLFSGDLSSDEIIARLLAPVKGESGETRAAAPKLLDAAVDLHRLRDALEKLADDSGFSGRDNPAFRTVLETVRTTSGLLDTHRLMNSTTLQKDDRGQTFLAVPFFMQGQPMPSPSEVRIYPPPRRRPGETARLQDLKVSFYLNMAQMGRMKIDLHFANNALNFHFLVSSQEVRAYLHGRSSGLLERLEAHDMKVAKLDLSVGEVPELTREVAKKAEMAQIQKLGRLDLRA